jgi:hypothetical protein
VNQPVDADGRWRRNGTWISSLALLLGLSTILPWFARNTILPADDGHLEFLTAWTPGRAVAATGDGWAGPLREVPWGWLIIAVAVAGTVGAHLAKRRAAGEPAARVPVLICVASAGLGLVLIALAWTGAASGADTSVMPMFGAAIAFGALVIWLVLAVTMLRANRAGPPAPGPTPRSRKARRQGWA